VGRSYEAVIRVNSQSGKGGMAYLMKADHKLDLPRRLQMEFSRVVQRHADTEGGEVTSDQLWQIFSGEYLTGEGPLDLVSCTSVSNGNGYRITATVRHNGVERQVEGEGNGPLSAFVDGLALGYDVRVLDYTEHALLVRWRRPGGRLTWRPRSPMPTTPTTPCCGASASTSSIVTACCVRSAAR
jgi:2-isopropylmalate synthase